MIDTATTLPPFYALESHVLAYTVNIVLDRMRGFRNFPHDYLVVDVETSGIEVGRDLILQFGYCLVIDGKVEAADNILLNWFARPDLVPGDWLQQRLARCKEHVERRDGRPTGRKYHFTPAKVKEGIDPLEGLAVARDLIDGARAEKVFLVAHNGYHFDARILRSHFGHFLGTDFEVGDDEMFDTGMVEKASQTNLVPWSGESIKHWSKRVQADRARGVRWSLDKTCVEKYALDVNYGVDTADAHDAGYDCVVTHFLFETYKERARRDAPEESRS
jgi:hypothetical protein